MTSPLLQPYMDSTMLSTFRSCPQKFYNEFILGLRPSGLSVDLHAGACFSGTLESFYRLIWIDDLDAPTALARAHRTYLTLWGSYSPNKETPKTFDRVWAAIEDYIHTYPPRTDHVQPYFVGDKPTFEFSFAVPLDAQDFPRHPISGEPWLYVGRADLLGQYLGRPIIRDEKTAGRLETHWAEKWDLRSQFIGYCWAARQSLGIDINTVIVRGVIITKKEIRQVEAIKVYNEHLIRRWYEQLRRDLWRITDMWRRHTSEGYEAFDVNFGEACTQYGSCVFMPLCQSPHPENWYSTFEVKRWNPLLKNPTEAGAGQSSSPASDAAKTASDGSASTTSSEPAIAAPHSIMA